MKRKVVLATIGSLGDLHPFIALGLALQDLGVEVCLAGADEYAEKIRNAGLAFRPMRPAFGDLERRLGMTRTQLTTAVLARNDFLFRRLIVPHVRESYEDMLQVAEDADLILTSSLAFGARLAAERLEVPWIGIVLQPLMFWSAHDPPALSRATWVSALLQRCGPAATRLVLDGVKFAVGRLLGPVRRLRSEIGLPPSGHNPLFEGQFSTLGAIGLYSDLLGAPRADYPQPVTIAGFATFDSEHGGSSNLVPELSAFLAAGAPPLVFTLGSLIVHSPGDFFATSLAAASALGCRAVLLVGEAALARYAGQRTDSVCVCAYAPHSLLFPHAAAIVHQGGIGTLAQALRSGRPQLIIPFFGDQMDNAARATQLGVASSLTPRRYTTARAVRELRKLCSDPAYERRASWVRSRLLDENGAARAAAAIMDRLESAIAHHGDLR